MLSIRSLARAAPRTLGRVARQTTGARPGAAYSLQTSTSSAFLRTQRASAFSTTSAFRKATAGEADEELVAKLESEIKFEDEAKQTEQLPASVSDFLENSPFELHDTPGKEDVKLTRTFGEEKITITFSIADLANYDPEMYEQDRALEDEEDFETDGMQNTNKQSGVQSTGGARSASAEEAFEEEGVASEDDLDEAAPPTRLTIVVEKPGRSPGALNIDAVAQDGAVVVENLFYYDDAALANPTNPETAQRRADVYPGPPFGSLDEDLQILMERYLEERGVTQALAVFAPDYVDVKEQKEYTRWLNNVKGFIDA